MDIFEFWYFSVESSFKIPVFFGGLSEDTIGLSQLVERSENETEIKHLQESLNVRNVLVIVKLEWRYRWMQILKTCSSIFSVNTRSNRRWLLFNEAFIIEIRIYFQFKFEFWMHSGSQWSDCSTAADRKKKKLFTREWNILQHDLEFTFHLNVLKII